VGFSGNTDSFVRSYSFKALQFQGLG